MLVSMVGGPPSDQVNCSSALALDSSGPPDLTSTFTSTLSRGSAGINLSFSFSFEGSAVEVHGSGFWNLSQSPTWECSLDQIPANTPNIPSGPGAWERQRDTPAALNRPHVLTVNVTDSGPTRLRFDYTPSDKLGSQAGLISGIYRIDKNGPAILYNPGWNIFGNGTSTPTRNTQLSLNGQAVSFPESSPAESPSAMTASYSVDGKPPIIFSLNHRGGNTTTATFDLEFFGVTSLVPGNHSLQVAHLGGPAIGTSLSLYYFRGLGLISGSISKTNGTTPPFALPQQPSGQTIGMGQTIGRGSRSEPCSYPLSYPEKRIQLTPTYM
ncbi:hypothetical protein BD779DRAFT_1668477 [Infundibulicybe gibba]|nr:hypothetical protein BD779DRAFT_1668477 [Infundibulicybe gibba]